MHTIKILGGGFLLLVACLLVGRALGHTALAIKAFVLFWFVAAGVNMYFGVTQAGYSVASELPMFFLVFGVPAIVAGLLLRSLARSS